MLTPLSLPGGAPACRGSHRQLSFFAILGGGAAISGESQVSPSLIPAGLVGEVRRSTAGARLAVDHRHPELEFDLVLKGAGGLVLDERSYALKPGTLIWLVPGQRHRLVRSPGLEMWVVSLRPELLDAGRIAELAGAPLHILPGEELLDLDRLLSQVAQDSDQPAVYNAGIAYLTLRAWRASRTSPAARTRPMHAGVARALMKLRESGAAVSLSELADAAGIAAPYLSRLLVEHTGRSFVDWRNRIRLDRFMDFYRPGANLLDAALGAGFGSYARFHHVFSEIIGCTPSEWAREAEQAGAPPEAKRAATPPPGYGVPGSSMLSARQGWTRLLPLIGPAACAVLGPSFLARLLAARPSGARARHFEHLDASLPPAARERLIALLRLKDPARAEELAGLIAAHDFPGTAAGVLGMFGLSVSRLGDVVTALAIALWVAATGASDPGMAEVEAVGCQVGGALAATLSRLDPQAAQDGHDALLCHFVIAYQAIRAARASGDPRAFEQLAEAARYCGREAFGGDLTKVKLASRGFAKGAG